MRYTVFILCLALAACGTPQIDVSQLERPKPWVLKQHVKVAELATGDELFERFDVCRVDQNTLVDKHAIASRWIKNVTPQKK